MSGRTHAAYVNYFQNGRKAHRLAEVERQLAAETSHQQEKRQLEAEARSAENIADHFPSDPGYAFNRNAPRLLHSPP